MRASPFVPATIKAGAFRSGSGRSQFLRQTGGKIWIPWHVLRRFLGQRTTIIAADDSGQRWRTALIDSVLRWTGRNKRSFRRQYLKMHRFPVSTKKRL